MDANLDAERAHGAPLPHQPEIYYKGRMLHCIPVCIKGSCAKIDICRKNSSNTKHRDEIRIHCTRIIIRVFAFKCTKSFLPDKKAD